MSAHHVVPVKNYVAIFLALMVLTATTVGVAFIDLGALNTVVALAIAVCKMLLVILFFMHVIDSSKLTKIVVLAGFLWLAIMISLTLSDILTRNWIPDPPGWGSRNFPAPQQTPQGPATFPASTRLRLPQSATSRS